MTIGERIRVARRAAGFTQAAVAASLTIDQTTLSAWERDDGPGPRVAHVEQMADLFAVDFTWLAIGEGSGPAEAA